MNAVQPPKLATVLLRRLVPGNTALAGDLAEEFRRRRSRPWYWRQVIGAIVFDAFREIRDHKLVAIRAIALGFICVELLFRYVVYDALHYDEWLFTRGLVKWFYLNGYGLPQWAMMPAIAVVSAAGGWIVGRTHRRYGSSMVFAFALFVTVYIFGLGFWRLTFFPLPSQRFYAVFNWVSWMLLLGLPSALIGGLWAVGTKSAPTHIYHRLNLR